MSDVIFLPHGGGPMPLLGDPAYKRLADVLGGLNGEIAGAKAVIVVTAHWEEERASLSTAAHPGMLYDYYGFPDAAYEIRYPAPGAPELAAKVGAALEAAGIDAAYDGARGYDHGVFVPMALIRPEADVPVLQMSLLASLDPAAHIRLGEALAPVLEDGVVLVGSGFSFHNLPALVGRLGGAGAEEADAFHDWLNAAVLGAGLEPAERSDRLARWAEASGARFCHPREEHLLPLHVCHGAAAAKGLAAESFFDEPVKGYRTVGYRWT